MKQNAGIYIHIPFCRSKCIYCDFNSYSGLDHLFADYVDAVCREIGFWSRQIRALPFNLRPAGFTSLYFGGGTPSILPPGFIEKLVESCHTQLSLTADAEISMEANPGTIDKTDLAQLHSAGINRLSLGVQSLLDRDLLLLRRIHDSHQAIETVNAVRSAGFGNLSIDLMFGLPYQTLDDWAQNLEAAIALEPDHISLYSLTIEEETPLALLVGKGEIPEPDPDLAADMYQATIARLQEVGFRHYEISNWAKPGHECRHNVIYWQNGPYLGLGAGAHSSLYGKRFSNLSKPAEYISAMQNLPASTPEFRKITDYSQNFFPIHDGMENLEDIPRDLEMAETMFLGLRLTEGVTLAEFAERFSVSLEDVYTNEIRELEGLSLLQRTSSHIALTPRGLPLANEVFVRFLPATRGPAYPATSNCTDHS